MELNQEQQDNKAKIEAFCKLIGMDSKWPVAVGMTESSLGMNQKSPTGCRGVFQMSSIAMKDLLLAMETNDDDWNDIACGVLFLRLLLRRHKTIDAATARFCDPADVSFYVDRVKKYMEEIYGRRL